MLPRATLSVPRGFSIHIILSAPASRVNPLPTSGKFPFPASPTTKFSTGSPARTDKDHTHQQHKAATILTIFMCLSFYLIS